MQRKAHSQFQELYAKTSLSVSNLKKVKLSDAAVEQIRDNIRTMDGRLEKVPVKEEKLGVNSKQTETHTRSRSNNKTNELARQNSMV